MALSHLVIDVQGKDGLLQEPGYEHGRDKKRKMIFQLVEQLTFLYTLRESDTVTFTFRK